MEWILWMTTTSIKITTTYLLWSFFVLFFKKYLYLWMMLSETKRSQVSYYIVRPPVLNYPKRFFRLINKLAKSILSEGRVKYIKGRRGKLNLAHKRSIKRLCWLSATLEPKNCWSIGKYKQFINNICYL